jgi:Cu+-exporting ATPase
MEIDPADAAAHETHQGTDYHFCSNGCATKFRADPARYLTPQRPVTAAPSTATGQWTCPMHPEVLESGPGACPICGMALEPLTPSLEPQDNPELAEMSRRLWVSATLSVPLLLLSMGAMLRCVYRDLLEAGGVVTCHEVAAV